MAKLTVVILLTLLHCVISFKETWSAGKHKTDSALNFLVVGDWGGQTKHPYTTPAEVDLAKVMGKRAKKINSQFTLALGDNFYDSGVKDVEDKRFKETFEDVFTAKSLQTPWYVVCGNHDYYGNCSAEIAYSKVSSRWNFPDFYYTQDFAIPLSEATVSILFIDTIILAGLTHHEDRSIPPSGPASRALAEDQWAFINETLSKWSQPGNEARWRIVVGHYPVWSVAKHGPTKILVDRLKPLLELYGVTAYICGHDHNMQHLNDSGVQYYVSGAGHLIDPSHEHEDDVPKGSLKYYYGPDKHKHSTGAFATVSATSTEFTVTFFDDKGKKLYKSVSTRH